MRVPPTLLLPWIAAASAVTSAPLLHRMGSSATICSLRRSRAPSHCSVMAAEQDAEARGGARDGGKRAAAGGSEPEPQTDPPRKHVHDSGGMQAPHRPAS